MNTSEKFQDFLSNIKIPDDYTKTISNRYATITKRLNKEFRIQTQKQIILFK